MADENPQVPEAQEGIEKVDPTLADLVQKGHFDVTNVLAIQERYQKAKAELLQKYPEVAEDLERSFQTPQIGPHHLEGKTLESHIALILHVIEQLDRGEVDENIQDPALRQLLVDTIKKHKAEFTEYAFLHDMAKPDRMKVIPEDGNEEMEITWDDWLEIQAQGEPYSVEVPELKVEVKGLAYFAGTGRKNRLIAKDLDVEKESIQHLQGGEGVVLNPTKDQLLKDQELFITWEEWGDIKTKGEPYTYVRPAKKVPIKSLGYYHQSKGLEDGSHGNVAARVLSEKLGDRQPNSLTLMMVRMHETAFQKFAKKDNMSAQLFEENYKDFSDEDMDIILTASYVDFAGTIKAEEGAAAYTPLLNVITARNNYKLINRYLESCPDDLRESMFPDKNLNKLRNANKKLTQEGVENTRTKLKTYTAEEVRDALLQAKGKKDTDIVTPDEIKQVVAILATGEPVNLNDAGRVLRAKLKFTMSHLINIGTDPFVLKPE